MPAASDQGGIWLPMAQVLPLHIQRLGRMSTMLVQNKKLAQDLAAMAGGRAAKPKGIVTIPVGDTPVMIAGLGACEAAEMEDIALEAIEKAEAQMKKTGTAVDFAEERERRGLPDVETFDTRVREYMQARADAGKRNFRTAGKTPIQELGITRGQSMVTVPEKRWGN